jgi:hypothetical protein
MKKVDNGSRPTSGKGCKQDFRAEIERFNVGVVFVSQINQKASSCANSLFRMPFKLGITIIALIRNRFGIDAL